MRIDELLNTHRVE
jgi:serine/threonine protein phosphatase PrpC